MQFIKLMGTALMLSHVAIATTNSGPTEDFGNDEIERQVQEVVGNQSVTNVPSSALLPRMRVDYTGEGRKFSILNSSIEQFAENLRHGSPILPRMNSDYNGEYHHSNSLVDAIIKITDESSNSSRLATNIIEFAEKMRQENRFVPRDLHTRTEVVENHEPLVLTAEQNAKKIEYITNYGHYKLHEVSKAFPSGQIPEKEIDNVTMDIATTMLQYFSFVPSEASMVEEDEKIEKRDAGRLRKEHDHASVDKKTESVENEYERQYKSGPSEDEDAPGDAWIEEHFRSHHKGTHKWLDGSIHPVWEEDPAGGQYYSWPYNVAFEMFKHDLGYEMGHEVAVKVWEIVTKEAVEKDRKAVEKWQKEEDEKARKYPEGKKEEGIVY